MSKYAWILGALVLGLILGLWSSQWLPSLIRPHTPAVVDEDVSGDTARLAWEALVCSVYAEFAKDQSEHSRLFQLGYESGRVFIERATDGGISDEELRTKVPIVFRMWAKGPSADFAVGALWKAALDEAYDRVVKQDDSGLMLPESEWRHDGEARRLWAGSLLRSSNCSLIKK